MNVLIFGAGRRGLRIGRHLIEEGKSVTFLDSSLARCQVAEARLDCMAICGSVTNIEKLEEAGIAEADTVIAVTGSDEVNIVSCGLVAANYPNVTKTIAAIRSITYIGSEGLPAGRILGINHIVNPDQEGAFRIAEIIKSGLYHDTIAFPDTNFLLFTATVTAQTVYANRTLADMRKYAPFSFVITGIRRKGHAIVPSGDTMMREGDILAVVADNEDAYEVMKSAGEYQRYEKPERIVIVGATRVSRYLLNLFSPAERSTVRLVEKDEAMANEFAVLFPEVLVLNSAITDEQIWDEEDIANADLFISLTENDELNIITSSYAKRNGAKRSIALIKTNTNYCQFAQSLDIDVALSIVDVTADSVVKNIRGTGVSALHTLFNGDLEVYDYVIQEDFHYLGKALKEVNLKNRIIIAGVRRPDGTSFVPTGDYVFSAGDNLIFSVAHQNIDFVQEFFG